MTTATENKQEGLLVRIPEHLLPKGFDSATESFALSFSGSELLILKRRRRDEKAADRQVVRLWGDVRSFAVPDILLLLFANHQTGLLTFELPDAHKAVYVQNGEPVYAQSSLQEDRLGECLVRMGKLTNVELEVASSQIDAKRKLGKILVEGGHISAKELFDGVRQQTLDIIYSLFGLREGKFNFFESELENRKGIVLLNLDPNEVLIEGLKRELGIVDPSLDFDNLFPVISGKASHTELNADERRIFSFVSENRSISEIIDLLRQGPLQALRLLYHLERMGLVRMTRREEMTAMQSWEGRLERTVNDFNSIFMDVYSILHAKVSGVDVLGRLNSFFHEMPPEIAEVFDGVRFEADGSLPMDRVLANLQFIEREDKVALTIKAFNELLYFTLFEMRNFLSREDAERLMEIVQNMELF